MTTMASQITSLTVVYPTVYSDADQRKHQSSASLAFVWGIHRDRWIPRTKASYAENVSIWWRHHVIDIYSSIQSPKTFNRSLYHAHDHVRCLALIIYFQLHAGLLSHCSWLWVNGNDMDGLIDWSVSWLVDWLSQVGRKGARDGGRGGGARRERGRKWGSGGEAMCHSDYWVHYHAPFHEKFTLMDPGPAAHPFGHSTSVKTKWAPADSFDNLESQ